MITERDLIAFTRGKKRAFDKLYEAYAPGMYAICLRYLRNEDDAKDTLQETFIKVYNNRKAYDVEKPIGAWIKTITIRTAINMLRERKKLILSDEEIQIPVDPQEGNTSETDDLKNQLQCALNKLPEGYRLVFNLFAIENLTHKEIAEHLGIAVGTSKSQYAKAKKMLQQLLQKERIAS